MQDFNAIANAGGLLQNACFSASSKAGWWAETDKTDANVICTKLLLIVSEVCEGMEGLRKNLPDDKLPHRAMLEVELADAAIRIFDLAGALNYDIGAAIAEKMAYNAKRADHKPENRAAVGGKKF